MADQPRGIPKIATLHEMLNNLGWRGMGAFLLSFVGMILVIMGGLMLFQRSDTKQRTLRITSGTEFEMRENMVRFMTQKIAERNLVLENVPSQGSLDALQKIDRGEIDLAIVQGGLHLDADSSVREVAAIDIERLHLVVRAEHFSAISGDLKTLRGKKVFLNYSGSGTNHLSRLLLARVGLSIAPKTGGSSGDSVIASGMNSREILSVLDFMRTADKDGKKTMQSKLPDACFLMASLPSRLAWRLINEADYRLVPLPYAAALAMTSIDEATNDSDKIDQLEILPTEIPAFTYNISPAIPASACPTIGFRTLLVAHKDVPDDAVLRMLPLIYEETIRGIYRPPELGKIVPEYPLHRAAIRYRDRNKPIVASEVADLFRTLFSVLGPVVGFILTLYGYYRWRQLLRFTKYFRKVIHLDLVAKGLSADRDLPTDPAERFQYLDKKLTHLQQEAVTDFCDNYFRGEAIVFNLLALLAETAQVIRSSQPTSGQTDSSKAEAN